MKIALISDTHGIFREEWVPHITACDYLIHAGDINTKTCYEKFKSLGVPAYFVKGNTDMGEWAANLPEFLSVPIGGKIFYISHNQYDFPFDLTDADFLIFGHTHVYTYYEQFGKVYVNPGSAAQPRGDSKSMAVLELNEDSSYHITRIFL